MFSPWPFILPLSFRAKKSKLGFRAFDFTCIHVGLCSTNDRYYLHEYQGYLSFFLHSVVSCVV